MLRWLYPKDRDYSFTLWDFFVSLTLLVLYVAGFRMLMSAHGFNQRLANIQRHPEQIYFKLAEDRQFEFHSSVRQEMAIVVYQLKERRPTEADYARTILPFKMEQQATYYSAILNFRLVPERNELVINDVAVPMVLDKAYRKQANFGNLSIAHTQGYIRESEFLFAYNDYFGKPNRENLILWDDCVYIAWLMDLATLEKAPEIITVKYRDPQVFE